MPQCCGLGFPAVAGHFYLSACAPRLPSVQIVLKRTALNLFSPIFYLCNKYNYMHAKFCGLVYWLSFSITENFFSGFWWSIWALSCPTHFLVADLLGQDCSELEKFFFFYSRPLLTDFWAFYSSYGCFMNPISLQAYENQGMYRLSEDKSKIVILNCPNLTTG